MALLESSKFQQVDRWVSYVTRRWTEECLSFQYMLCADVTVNSSNKWLDIKLVRHKKTEN